MIPGIGYDSNFKFNFTLFTSIKKSIDTSTTSIFSLSLEEKRKPAKTKIKLIEKRKKLEMVVGPDPAVLAAIEKGNVVVFFDIALGESGGGASTNNANSAELGRIKMELFTKDCPKTCENFRQFCTGEFLQNEQPTGYLNSTFHRVIKGFVLQGGDFVNNDGTGKLSIYGSSFADENLTTHKHVNAGMLSMANSGPNTNGCQFFITCAAAPHLDGKHTVFGQVLDDASMLTVRKCEAVPVNGSVPRLPLTITQCGEL